MRIDNKLLHIQIWKILDGDQNLKCFSNNSVWNILILFNLNTTVEEKEITTTLEKYLEGHPLHNTIIIQVT